MKNTGLEFFWDLKFNLSQDRCILENMNLNSYIDHTLLKADATKADIRTLCEEALQFDFFGVCVNSFYIQAAREVLKSSSVKIVSVIGFPLGANESSVKAFETSRCINIGADEIDMVINIGALKSGDFSFVKRDIEGVVRAAEGKPVKVIIETALLNKEEKIKACELSIEAKASFVKTSTGFSTAGATIEDIILMKSIVGSQLQIKASGGIKDLQMAKALIQAGATRLGTSSGVKLVQGLAATAGY